MSDLQYPGGMHVGESGAPGSPAIVFIHGAGQSGRSLARAHEEARRLPLPGPGPARVRAQQPAAFGVIQPDGGPRRQAHRAARPGTTGQCRRHLLGWRDQSTRCSAAIPTVSSGPSSTAPLSALGAVGLSPSSSCWRRSSIPARSWRSTGIRMTRPTCASRRAGRSGVPSRSASGLPRSSMRHVRPCSSPGSWSPDSGVRTPERPTRPLPPSCPMPRPGMRPASSTAGSGRRPIYISARSRLGSAGRNCPPSSVASLHPRLRRKSGCERSPVRGPRKHRLNRENGVGHETTHCPALGGWRGHYRVIRALQAF